MSHLNLWGLRFCWGKGGCLQLSNMLMFLQEWNRDTQIYDRISRYSTVTWFIIFFISFVLLLICIKINPFFFAVPQGPAQAVKLPWNKRSLIDLTTQRTTNLASTWASCKTTASQMSGMSEAVRSHWRSVTGKWRLFPLLSYKSCMLGVAEMLRGNTPSTRL